MLRITDNANPRPLPWLFQQRNAEALDLDPKSKVHTCEMCGKSVEAVNKDGEWLPKNHASRDDGSVKRERARWVGHA